MYKGSLMPSLLPYDGDTTKKSTGINANSTTITAAGLPHGAIGTSKIVVLLDNDIDKAVNSIVILLLLYTAFRGEQNAFSGPLAAIGTSWSSRLLVWVDGTLARDH